MTRAPVHAFLFVLLPIFSMYAVLPGTSQPDEILVAALFALGAGALLLAAAWIVYRDVRKAALLVSGFVVLFAVYDDFERWLRASGLPGAGRLTLLTLPIAYLLLAGLGVLLYRLRRPLEKATMIVNVMAVAALAVPATSVLAFQAAAALDRAAPPLAEINSRRPVSATPDVWYIVLDRYGSAQTLGEFGYDNEPFYRFLESRGFYVARASRANYIKTPLSLASSLNMSYLDDLATVEGRESNDWLPVYDRLENHRVGRFFKSRGYDYIHSGSYWWPTRENDNATENINYYDEAPNAVVRLLRRGLLEPIGRLPSPVVNVRLQQWQRVRAKMDELSKLASRKSARPRFVLVHILVPHGPYVLDADGSYLSADLERQRDLNTNYINQVIAINGMMRPLLDRILKGSSTAPVILLQADEGPYPEGTNADEYDWTAVTPAILRQRSGILNAYYLPGGGAKRLYPSISPVNSFRVVLNHYFGTELSLLPDRTYAHETEERPYSFFEITQTVAAGEAASTATVTGGSTNPMRSPDASMAR